MTTAARPTFNAAKGLADSSKYTAVSKQISSKDLPGQLTLKTRQFGQNSAEEIRQRDLKAELFERERKHLATKNIRDDASSSFAEDSAILADAERVKRLKAVDKDDDFLQNDDDSDSEHSENSKDDGSNEDDSDDDEAELMRELERIKQERAEENMKKEREQKEMAEREKRQQMLAGNPLLHSDTFTVKRRWDDDVVFKNQARGEVAPKKRFINDTIRNDFHKKFLSRYIQ